MQFPLTSIASVKYAFFELSLVTCKMNGMGIDNSDLEIFCDGTPFDVEGII